jgi:two-component system response regulator DegU
MDIDTKIRIILTGDHKILCEGLRALFDRRADMDVVGEARDYVRAMLLAQEVEPDVIVMNVNMPGMDGVEATRRLAQALPDTRIVALSMHPEETLVREILNAGASVCVLKEQTFDELVQAVKTVHSGETYLSTKETSVIADDCVQN